MSAAGNASRRWSSPKPVAPDAVDVFIACAPEDLNTAVELRTALEPLTGWIPERDMVPGDVRDIVVAQVLESCALVVVLVPREPREEWFHLDEVQQAIALAKSSNGLRRVIPVYLQGQQPPTRVIYGLRRIYGIYLALEGSWPGVAGRVREVVYRVRRTDTVASGAPAVSGLPSRLHALESQRRTLAEAGHTDPDLDAERRALIHELRAGGRLNTGDALGGRYTLRALLGKGGFGQVWRAYDEVHRLDVAVKVLHAHHADEADGRRRFARGVRAMTQLEHPYVVRVRQGVTEDEGLVFFVMSLLPGGDLADAIKDGRVAPHDVQALILPLADALAVAHRQGILHRDVKPANILLDAMGRPCLTDFDLARAPDSEAMTSGGLGTWGYAAPECRTDAGSAGPTADVFGLAMTAVSIILQRPMGADDPLHIDRILASSSDPLVQVFAPTLRPALRAHPGERTASMERLMAGLGAVVLPTDSPSSPGGTATATPRPSASVSASTGQTFRPAGEAARTPVPESDPASAEPDAVEISPEDAGGCLILFGLLAVIIWLIWKKWG